MSNCSKCEVLEQHLDEVTNEQKKLKNLFCMNSKNYELSLSQLREQNLALEQKVKDMRQAKKNMTEVIFKKLEKKLEKTKTKKK